ncbi:mediator complex, subunit Med21 [Calycina marina]|uniref:Mediator of RNA polymerase II transcription subunit 21 n=1 Tax=Calycina marina TaxID=1763456 RepID=A0A9P7Z5N8_9HELO|nr:mediator complex, subunit Med21 [Calycina marina]
MGDKLTQIQEAVDDLANQMVACLYYLNRHHDWQTLSPNDVIRGQSKNEFETAYDKEFGPRNPVAFKAAQKELAKDLVIKEQQIEYLISHLPGLANNEEKQEEAIRRLEAELVIEEEKRKEAVKEREVVLDKLDTIIRGIKRPR